MDSNKLNAKDLLAIASSQWASAKDIMIIGSVGRNKAYAIRNEIIADYYDGDKKVRICKHCGASLDEVKSSTAKKVAKKTTAKKKTAEENKD